MRDHGICVLVTKQVVEQEWTSSSPKELTVMLVREKLHGKMKLEYMHKLGTVMAKSLPSSPIWSFLAFSGSVTYLRFNADTSKRSHGLAQSFLKVY